MEVRWLCAMLLVLPGAWGDCEQPPRFVFAEPPQPLQESYAVGTTLRYTCRPGYTVAMGKSLLVTCLPNSTWMATPDFCIGKSCGPPDIMNGRFDYTTNLQFGATITYTCNTGYRLVGKPSAQCVLTGNEVAWDHVPYCAPISCLPPPVIENGQLINENTDFTFGMAVTYKCNNNSFSLIGDATIHCTTHDNLQGTWSGPAPECKVVACKNPEVENGRRLSGFGTAHTYKNTVTFECNPGHLLNGSSVVTCEADSTWKPPLPTCDPMYCGPAPQFLFAELTTAVGDRSPVGTKLRYQCKPGYAAASGKSSLVTCLSDTTWSADPDFCIRQQCTPPTIENGDVTASSFLFESVVTFTCHPGYELKGSPSAKCVVSGNGVDWDTAPPYCESQLPRILCKDPPTIDNGMHNGTKGTEFVYGSVVVYKCNDGFTLAGAASIHCKADHQYHGVWSEPIPECKGDVPPVEQFPHVFCGKPPTIDNGMHNGTKGTEFVYGSVVVYKCNDGFTLAGAASIHCKADHQYHGVWSEPIPECKGDVPPVEQFPHVFCGKPPTIDNGMHNGTKDTGFVRGSTVAYKCNDGYTLVGAALLQCIARDQYQGVWSKPAPECRGGANMIIVGIFPLLLAILVMNI